MATQQPKNQYTYTGVADPTTGRYLNKGELIRYGDTGAGVEAVQNALNTIYGVNLNSGVYDDATRRYVEQYKQLNYDNNRGSGNTYSKTIGNDTLRYLLGDAAIPDTYDEDANNTYYGAGTNSAAILGNIRGAYGGMIGGLSDVFNIGKQNLEQNYDELARQYYIQSRQNENKLGETISNMGITGGASESALIDLLNTYGASLQNNMNEKNAQLNDLYSQFMQQKAQLQGNMYMDLMNTENELLNLEAQADYENQLRADNAMNAYIANQVQYVQNQQDAAQLAAQQAWQQRLDARNQGVSERTLDALNRGLTVYTYTDANGKDYVTANKNKAMASGYNYKTLTPKK